VTRFAQHASELLDAAKSAVARGEACSDVTILIGQDSAIHMLSDCDWALDSLALHHGAKSVYRVSIKDGTAQVEGREDGSTCVMRSEKLDARRFLRCLAVGR